MLIISKTTSILNDEVELTPIRAQGAGGQHVNKVSTAIHLRFNIHKSSLPFEYKDRLIKFKDGRITNDGIVIIKAQRFRSLEKNRLDALQRLVMLIHKAIKRKEKRIKTKPSKNSIKKRLDNKNQRGNLKKMRQPPSE